MLLQSSVNGSPKLPIFYIEEKHEETLGDAAQDASQAMAFLINWLNRSAYISGGQQETPLLSYRKASEAKRASLRAASLEPVLQMLPAVIGCEDIDDAQEVQGLQARKSDSKPQIMDLEGSKHLETLIKMPCTEIPRPFGWTRSFRPSALGGKAPQAA